MDLGKEWQPPMVAKFFQPEGLKAEKNYQFLTNLSLESNIRLA